MKKISIILLCLVIVLSFYSCSGKKDDGKGSFNSNIVIGKIEAIDGNKITLAVADMESMFGGKERPSGDFGSFNKDKMPENFDPESFDGEMPENFNPEDFFGGEIPEGFDPENFGGERPEGFERPEGGEKGERPDRGEIPEDFAPQMGGMMNFDTSSLTFSGETKEYTIPEGMKIGDGDYTSLKVGDVIMIMFDAEGGIGEIRVMPMQEAIEETTAA